MAELASVDVREGTVFTIRNKEEVVASAITAPYRDGVQCIRLFTNPKHRNEGHATEIMLRVLEHHKYVKVYVLPKPFADCQLSDVDLFEWYMTLDFEPCGDLLVRKPK